MEQRKKWILEKLEKNLSDFKYVSNYKNKEGLNILFQVDKDEFWFILNEEKKLLKLEYYGAGKGAFDDTIYPNKEVNELWEKLRKVTKARIRLLFL